MQKSNQFKIKKPYIAHIESSLNWGGQELRIIEQTEWLINNGYKSIIIGRPSSKIIEEAKKRNLPYFELKIRGSVNLLQIIKLIIFLRNNKIDILDTHSSRDASYAMFVKFFTNIKIIRSRHVTDTIKNDFFHSFIWKYGSHSIVTTAEKIKSDIIKLKLYNKDKIFVAPAGVDKKRFDRKNIKNKLNIKKELNIPINDKVIANIGMIRPDKGQIYYIKMCELLSKKYKNITFLQIGEETNDTKTYKNKIINYLNNSPYKNRIKFIGYKKDIENYLSIVDIVVISSIGTEAQTRLVSQSFLMKSNVVATNVGGLPEMIQDYKTGLLCKPKNPKELAKKVSLLLENKSLRLELAKNAYLHAIKYNTFEYMMDFMLKVYNGVLNDENISY